MPWKTTNTAKGDNKLYSDAKGVVPSLDLRFAEGKTLNDYMTGQNLITFSRSSIGTYVDENGIIQTATADTPRFDHDPTTGESLGLLVEEQRTNNVTYSATQADYSLQGTGTAAPSSTVAPDSTTNTCIRVQGLALNDGISKATLISTTGDYFPTVYARSRTGASQDVKVTQSGSVGPTITLPADGSWIRVTGQVGTLGSGNRDIRISQATANPIDIDVWGFQTELGAFPTSYIPTTGTALTRSADVASITGSNFSSWYNQSEGTYYAEVFSASTDAETILSSRRSDGVEISNGFRLYSSTQYNRAICYLVSTQNDFINYSPTTGKNKLAVAGSSSSTNAYFNSVQGTILASRTPQALTVAGIEFGGAAPPNAHISRLTYFPERLPDATLQAITA